MVSYRENFGRYAAMGIFLGPGVLLECRSFLMRHILNGGETVEHARGGACGRVPLPVPGPDARARGLPVLCILGRRVPADSSETHFP